MWQVYDKESGYVYAKFFKRPEALKYSKLLKGMYGADLGVKKDDNENLQRIIAKVQEGWIFYHIDFGWPSANPFSLSPERIIPTEDHNSEDEFTKDSGYFWAKSDEEAQAKADQWRQVNLITTTQEDWRYDTSSTISSGVRGEDA
jgi:hypothetical protein